MKLARLAFPALALGGILGCVAQEPSCPTPLPVASPPVAAEPDPRDASHDNVVFRERPFQVEDSANESPKSRIGNAGPEEAKPTPAPKASPADELLALQKEIVARDPAREDEKLRLVLLEATAGHFEEAEMLLSGIQSRSNKLFPILEFFLRRELGEQQEARKLLAALVEEEKRVTGFVIERAVLCSSVRRYRDYEPAETDRVRPGSVAILYVEPRNFTMQRQEEKYLLHLKYDWRLYNDRSVEQVIPAWESAAPADREDCKAYAGPVEEFHQSFTLRLPANLAMGDYRIKVAVTDAIAKRSAEVYVPIQVEAVE